MSYNVQCDNSTYTNRCNGRRKGEDNRTTDTVIARQSYLDVCINIPPVVKTAYYNRKQKQKKNKGEIPQCDHTQINTTQINMQNDQRSKSSINKNRAEMRDVMTVYYYYYFFFNCNYSKRQNKINKPSFQPASPPPSVPALFHEVQVFLAALRTQV
jgi:hypothetical protein